MAQSCATFGFNPNLVPSTSRGNLRAQQASPAQSSSASHPIRNNDSTNSSARSAPDVLVVSLTHPPTFSNNALTILHQVERCGHELISKDLDHIRTLRTTLREWVMAGVSFGKIGRYLELVLYNNDDHTMGRVTYMVKRKYRHIRIALDILEYYQIRDDEQKPYWLPRLGQTYGEWYSFSGSTDAGANEAPI